MATTQERPERMIKVIGSSRRSHLIKYVFAVFLFFAAYYSWFVRGRSKVLDIVASLCTLVGLFILTYAELNTRYKKIVVYNKGAVLEEGIFNRNSTTINYSRITEVSVKQSFFQRMLALGNIDIRTASSSKDHILVIENIPHPFKVKKLFEHFMFAVFVRNNRDT
jgi:uncharacterized membrane protein YdbT with pleckstrin-like domain